MSRGSKTPVYFATKTTYLVIGVPNVFIKQQLERKYNRYGFEMLAKNGVTPERVEYKIHSGSTLQAKEPDDEPDDSWIPAASAPNNCSQQLTTTLTHSYRQGLNERYTFENFIVGSGNELAYAACQAIAQSPGTKYNPLFVYGGVGIGKTHLDPSCRQRSTGQKPERAVVYASTEQFVQEFVDALRFKKTTDFAKHYRSADVLDR